MRGLCEGFLSAEAEPEPDAVRLLCKTILDELSGTPSPAKGG